ncbi:hypothetical protein [Aeromicrobium sp. CTD01-1L150]|uniref:hypothetical protein n=1 Tax=Aeromicrobium sp. CTD01-1L150 TaxID=3341830 RepID=UPI0035BEFDFB
MGSKKGDKEQVKALTRDVERLQSVVEKLEAKLEKRERKVARWKKAAKAERTRAAKLDAALRRATAPRPVDHAVDTGDVPVDPPAVASGGPAVPDVSWTVAQLRARAREHGVVGSSRMTKAELLKAINDS